MRRLLLLAAFSGLARASNVSANFSADKAMFSRHQANMLAIMIATIVVALLGNGFLFFVILRNNRGHQKQLSPVHILILHSCINDILFALITLLPQVLRMMTFPKFYGGSALCSLVMFFNVVPMYGSSFLLVAISLDRYTAVCRPLVSLSTNKHRRAQMLAVVAWTSAIAVSTPQLLIFRLTSSPLGDMCVAMHRADWLRHAYLLWFTSVAWLVPSLLSAAFYTAVCRESAASSGQRTKTVKLTLTIVACNFVLYAPFCICNVIYAYIPYLVDPVAIMYIMLIGNLNSCVNPWIYLLFNFRQAKQSLKVIWTQSDGNSYTNKYVLFKALSRRDKLARATLHNLSALNASVSPRNYQNGAAAGSRQLRNSQGSEVATPLLRGSARGSRLNPKPLLRSLTGNRLKVPGPEMGVMYVATQGSAVMLCSEPNSGAEVERKLSTCSTRPYNRLNQSPYAAHEEIEEPSTSAYKDLEASSDREPTFPQSEPTKRSKGPSDAITFASFDAGYPDLDPETGRLVKRSKESLRDGSSHDSNTGRLAQRSKESLREAYLHNRLNSDASIPQIPERTDSRDLISPDTLRLRAMEPSEPLLTRAIEPSQPSISHQRSLGNMESPPSTHSDTWLLSQSLHMPFKSVSQDSDSDGPIILAETEATHL